MEKSLKERRGSDLMDRRNCIAAEQGHEGPTDLSRLAGSMRGAIDDEFLRAIEEFRHSQSAGRS